MRLRMQLKGFAPLLMHSSTLVNPLDPATLALKNITKKRTKTEEDLREVARLSWKGSLYWTEETGPYMPGQNIEKALVEAARIRKLGKQFQRGVFVETLEAPLQYEGPRDPDELWASERFADMRAVTVQRAKLMRTRPRFDEWACEVTVELDTSQVSLDDFTDVAKEAGRLVGLGDYRPRYGRFTVEVEALRDG